MKRVGVAPHACYRSQGNLEPTFNRAATPITCSIQVMGLTLSGGLNGIIQSAQLAGFACWDAARRRPLARRVCRAWHQTSQVKVLIPGIREAEG